LSLAQNDAEEAQIKVKIAHTVRDEGNLVRAAQLYKEIAVQEEYPAMARAYSAQALGLLDNYGNSAVRVETFKDEPFAAMFVPDDPVLSYRHVFEYASSLYPLALSELRIASWYAGELLKEADGEINLTENEIATYHATVMDKLQRASIDAARTKDDPNEAYLKPEIARMRAIVLGWMVLAGYDFKHDAEQAYVDAMYEYSLTGAPNDGFMHYWYATYLSSFADRRDAVIQALTPLYTNPVYASSGVATFFTAERNNRLGSKGILQRLAKVDPKFKGFLTSLGWTNADF
jgi:hypothetical protein